MPDDALSANAPLDRVSRILQCYFGGDYGSLVRGSTKNGNSGRRNSSLEARRFTPTASAALPRRTFACEVSPLLLRHILHLLGPVFTAGIRSLFNQFISDDRVKRNNCP